MFSNKEINTFIGLFFAASQSSSPSPKRYHDEFTAALNEYFKCYPNLDADEYSFTAGDFLTDED